jgi:hypothetical protein
VRLADTESLDADLSCALRAQRSSCTGPARWPPIRTGQVNWSQPLGITGEASRRPMQATCGPSERLRSCRARAVRHGGRSTTWTLSYQSWRPATDNWLPESVRRESRLDRPRRWRVGQVGYRIGRGGGPVCLIQRVETGSESQLLDHVVDRVGDARCTPSPDVVVDCCPHRGMRALRPRRR